MVQRRILHCRFLIGLLLRQTFSSACLRRILYRVCFQLTSRRDRERFHPAQAEFVICDCTIENRLHWRRDVTLGEDACSVRFPPVAQMLAVLNPMVLALMDLHHVSNVARQLRRFASHPLETLSWVCYF